MTSMKEVVDAESWYYRGEGAANVVLAYRGDDPALIGKVLRLRKAVNNDRDVGNAIESAPVLSTDEQKLWADWPGLVSATTLAELNYVYARDVLRPLLGDKHVDPGTLVYVSSSFIESLNHNIGDKRPAWRAESGSLEALAGIGLSISDHTRFTAPVGNVQESPSTISVELKPKCGFLPMINEDNSVKKSVPRFIMHQHLKLHQGKIKQISKYDPLDLFSGSKDGILKAIRALFETPQNNLRIFLNGEEVFGESEGSSSDKNPSLAYFENILKEFVPAQAGGWVQAFQELVADLLFKSDILNKLLAVQKLDYLGIEGASKAYREYLSFNKSSLENSLKSKEIFLHNDQYKSSRPYSNEIEYQDEASQCTQRQSFSSSATFENCRKILRDFLISATAKDCGIMLTLQPWRESNADGVYFQNAHTVNFLNQDYLHKILLLDLDVKRLKKMDHYLELDQEIINDYTSLLLR